MLKYYLISCSPTKLLCCAKVQSPVSVSSVLTLPCCLTEYFRHIEPQQHMLGNRPNIRQGKTMVVVGVKY